jgi:hypothetical protein
VVGHYRHQRSVAVIGHSGRNDNRRVVQGAQSIGHGEKLCSDIIGLDEDDERILRPVTELVCHQMVGGALGGLRVLATRSIEGGLHREHRHG